MTSEFVIGDGYTNYRGPSKAGSVHRHAAFQIAVGLGDAHMTVSARDRRSRVSPTTGHKGAAARRVST